jgi:hypothetical protein
MSVRLFRVLVPAYLLLLAPSSARDLCKLLEDAKLGPLQDGQLFANGKSGWQTFASLSDLVARSPQETEFAYVIGTTGNSDRTGVLIIKTNRPATQVDTDQLRNRVRVVRSAIVADPGCADVGLPNSETSVSTQSFRDYHDFQPRATAALRQPAESGHGNEFDTLRAFHFEYRSARKRRCLRTDSDDDDDFPLNSNNNRAQFSFDRTVVANGSYSNARLFFWVPVSPFEGAAEHRVLVKKYATQGGQACVRFSVPIRSPDYTFQVNDLESTAQWSPNSRKEQVVVSWPGAR